MLMQAPAKLPVFGAKCSDSQFDIALVFFPMQDSGALRSNRPHVVCTAISAPQNFQKSNAVVDTRIHDGCGLLHAFGTFVSVVIR